MGVVNNTDSLNTSDRAAIRMEIHRQEKRPPDQDYGGRTEGAWGRATRSSR